MAGTNYILQFGENTVPPEIQTDVEYQADGSRTAGWQPGIVRQEFLNKVHRQSLAISAGIGQFMADNESGVIDITDDLSPAAMSAIFVDAISSGVYTTQPKFTANQTVATTQFVQNALGSFTGQVVYGVTSVLTGADVGKMIQATSSSITLTLPLASAVAVGSKIFVIAVNAAPVTVDIQGPDTINNGVLGSQTAVILNGYDAVELTSDGAIWVVTGGNAQLDTSSQFTGSLTVDGWSPLPGGRIEQWGRISPLAFDDTTKEIALPVTWPIGYLNGNISLAIGGGVLKTYNLGVEMSASTLNPLTHITVKGESTTTGGNHNVEWRAIGH